MPDIFASGKSQTNPHQADRSDSTPIESPVLGTASMSELPTLDSQAPAHPPVNSVLNHGLSKHLRWFFQWFGTCFEARKWAVST